MISGTIRVGTRKSRLALAQTRWVISELQKHYPEVTFEEVTFVTQGDRILDRPLQAIGSKGLFTAELEAAILAQEIDFAVHSLKDLPTEFPEGLALGPIPARAPFADVLVSHKFNSLIDLKENAVVGTGSNRRRVQLEAQRPDLQVQDIRGNVDTRIAKMEAGEYDAIILAQAGLERLDLGQHISEVLDFFHAPGQGALGIELRSDNQDLKQALMALEIESERPLIEAERCFLLKMGGGCHVPLGIRVQNDQVQGMISSADGLQKLYTEWYTIAGEKTGIELYQDLMAQGAQKLLEDMDD